MSASTLLHRIATVIGGARPTRLTILLVFSLIAGLAADWFRSDQRLLFPRPLPVFTTIPTAP